MELIRRPLNFEVRQVGPPSARTLEFIGSTAHVDRYGDIIEVSGWDLKHFKKNPVFLWGHNYNLPPVGTAKRVFKDGDSLKFHIYFPTDEEINAAGWPANMPTPETVYKLYLAGVLKATSVGFQSLEREPITDKKNEDQFTGWRFLKQELYELSAVPVPANPYALLQDAVQKGLISPEEAKKLEEAPSPEPEDRSPLEARLIEAGFLPEGDTWDHSKIIESLLDLADSQRVKIAELEDQKPLEVKVEPVKFMAAEIDWSLIVKEKVIPELEKQLAIRGKKVTDYYSTALNPGYKPHGERQAGEADTDAVEEQLHSLASEITKTL